MRVSNHRRPMTAIALALLLAQPIGGAALAQTTPPVTQSGPIDDLIGRGLQAILDDMLTRAEPHLDGLARDMQGMFEEYSPALKELSGLVDDIKNYQTPERLENGDILIRRKPDAPPAPPLSELQKLAPQEGPAPRLPGFPPPEAVPTPDSGTQPKITL